MTSALYLEHYLDSLENLPIELQRNFTLMRDLDSRAQNLMKEIDSLADSYLKSVKTLGIERRKEQSDKIQKLFNKAKEFGDDKVQLAIQTYELVDKHIRRLDNDLARFEAEIKEKAFGSSQSQDESSSSSVPVPVQQKRGRKKATAEKELKKKRIDASSEDDSAAKNLKRKQKKAAANASSLAAGSATPSALEATLATTLPLVGITHPADVLDMPVDPNEPTYCLCHQVSYGEMVGCDNLDCPIEWFHFTCVGLTAKPKGKWFCPKCTAERKKK